MTRGNIVSAFRDAYWDHSLYAPVTEMTLTLRTTEGCTHPRMNDERDSNPQRAEPVSGEVLLTWLYIWLFGSNQL